MSETAFTPGPWELDGNSDIRVVGGNYVASAMREADCRLIATAPELIEAGQALYDAIGEWKKPEQGFLTPELIAAGERWCKVAAKAREQHP